MSAALSYTGPPSTQSPFSRIPDDVAHAILTSCLSPALTVEQLAAAGYEAFQLIEELEKPFQFTLGAVCRNWRQIVWTDPQIWRFVQVTITATTCPSYVGLVKEWLGRSKQLPLVIVVAFWQKSWREQAGEDAAAPIVRPLISTLRSHAGRWSLLVASLHIPFLKELQSDQATNLEAVLLTPPIRNNLIYGRSRQVVLQPNTAPRARLIAVARYRSFKIVADWNILRHYIGEWIYPADCLDVLRNTPRLLSCSFATMFTFARNEVLANVTNPSVECLQLGDFSHNLLPYITCPSLRQVDLDLEYANFMPEILSFLERSGCSPKLTKVVFRRASISGMEYIELFESMPLIEELIFSSTAVEPIFLKELGLTREAATFLPNLRSLEASFHYRDTFPWSTFVEVTRRRPLRRIVISLFDIEARSEECNSEWEVINEASKLEVPGDWIGEEGILVAREIVDAGVRFEVLDQHGKDIVNASIMKAARPV